MALTYNQETYMGSDCNGSSGEANRVLTLSNINLTKQAGFSVYVGGLYLAKNTHYTVSHKSSNTEITLLNKLWDDMSIIINYYQLTATFYGKARTDAENLILENGQTFTLKRVTETTDTMGGVTAKTIESWIIVSVLQNITKKDRRIHEMGLAITGNMKAIFYHEYSNDMTGNGNVSVQVGDILEANDGKQWRVEQITAERYATSNEIFRVGVIKNINLEE